MATKITKTEQAFKMLEEGNLKDALKLFSTFKLGLTVSQQKALKTGYECIVHPSFYRQLKIDVDAAVTTAIDVCNQLRKPA